ncbi:MAG TPA: transposase [Candidatus Methylomirabilis sp.]|nr:transposase [Candidatus Methylomirabilis sp.]
MEKRNGRAAPLSKSAVSRIVGALEAEPEAWRTRSLANLPAVGLYPDALALRARSGGRKMVSVPVPGVAAALAGGQKQRVTLKLWGRVLRGREGLPGRPRRSRAAGPVAAHHRRPPGPTPSRRPRLPAGRRPAVVRPQAAPPRLRGVP